MTEKDVKTILGEVEDPWRGIGPTPVGIVEVWSWDSGADYIAIGFEGGKVTEKKIHHRAAYEQLRWHAKKWIAKIGVKWDYQSTGQQ